jgi:hypothetical protein
MTTPFADAVEAADRLPDDDQAALIDLLRRRMAEAGRRRVVAEARDARAEFAAGECRAASVDDILRDALS